MAMDRDLIEAAAWIGEHGGYCFLTDDKPFSVGLALPEFISLRHPVIYLLRRYTEQLEILVNRRDEGSTTIEV